MVQYECFGAVQEVVICLFEGKTAQAELKEGGKDVEVTFQNREEYVRRRKRIGLQFDVDLFGSDIATTSSTARWSASWCMNAEKRELCLKERVSEVSSTRSERALINASKTHFLGREMGLGLGIPGSALGKPTQRPVRCQATL